MYQSISKHGAITDFYERYKDELGLDRTTVNNILSEYYRELIGDIRYYYLSAKKYEQSSGHTVNFLEVGHFVLPYEKCLKLYNN
jgi:hypothetical protein